MSGEGLPLVRDELPELARGLEKRLRQQGLHDLADTVSELRIHRGGQTLYFIEPESISRPPPIRHGAEDKSKWSYMYHPSRHRHWLGTVPRRQWGLVVEEIDGQIAVLSVDHPGILRRRLDAMSG